MTTTPPKDETLKLSDLTAQEKAAYAYRTNQFQELAKMQTDLLREGLATIPVQIPNGPQLVVNACPADVMLLMQAQQHRIQQLEIGLGVLVDMLLQSRLPSLVPAAQDAEQLVSTTRDPELQEGAQPFLKAAGFSLRDAQINLEQFWLMCGKAAERHISLLRRGILSQHLGSQIAMPDDKRKRN